MGSLPLNSQRRQGISIGGYEAGVPNLLRGPSAADGRSNEIVLHGDILIAINSLHQYAKLTKEIVGGVRFRAAIMSGRR